MNTSPIAQGIPGTGVAKAEPWWRFPIVWLVVGGPLIVVVASLFTVGIAVRHVDPVLETTASPGMKPGHAPALLGRNQAAETATRPADR